MREKVSSEGRVKGYVEQYLGSHSQGAEAGFNQGTFPKPGELLFSVALFWGDCEKTGS
jgi:hypothetical protein